MKLVGFLQKLTIQRKAIMTTQQHPSVVNYCYIDWHKLERTTRRTAAASRVAIKDIMKIHTIAMKCLHNPKKILAGTHSSQFQGNQRKMVVRAAQRVKGKIIVEFAVLFSFLAQVTLAAIAKAPTFFSPGTLNYLA